MIFNPIYGSGGSSPSPALGTKTITANGTYNASSDNLDGYDEVTANVPNTYAAGDEGKVVSNGVLVAQSSQNITQNGTYDTTLKNSVTVNVQSGGNSLVFPSSQLVMTSSQTLDIKNGMEVGPFSSQAVYIRPLDTNGSLLKPDWRQPFEIKFRAKYTGTVNRSMVVYGAQQNYFYAPTVEFSSNGSGIWMAVPQSGSSWTYSIFFSSSEITMAANNWYDITLTYDGSKMTGVVYDGTNTVTKDIAISGSLYYSSSHNLEIGGIATSSGHYAQYLIIDFAKSYIKSQGSLVWGNAA